MLRDKRFWFGVAAGVFVVPMVMTKVPALANLRAHVPV